MSGIDFDTIICEVLREHENYGFEFTKKCMREACRKVLDKAAERAEAKVAFDGLDYIGCVDKKSILQIKEEL